MDDEHKAKLAQGRRDAAAVKAYLDFIEEHKPKRGRKRTRETVQRQLESVVAELEMARSLRRLQLIQQRDDLEAELEAMSPDVDGDVLRRSFIEVAGRYAAAKGISRSAFREMNVDAKTLTEAGI